MNASRTRARTLSVVVGLILIGLAACSQQPAGIPSDPPTDQDGIGAPTDPPTDPDDTGDPSADPIAVDWNDPGAVVTLDNGWELAHCEGDAPLLCVHDGDTLLGVVEAASSPFDDELAAVLDAEGLDAALARHVADYHETFAADRAEGCGDDYEYVAHETEQALLAGRPAVRYGFSGLLDGVEVERNVTILAIFDGQLKLITAVANASASCLHSEEFAELTPDDLITFEPYLTSLAAGSVLPPSTALLDGAVVGIDGGLDGGLVYYVWQGEKHRIQQPRAMTAADVEQLGLEYGPTVTGLVAGEVEGSWFAVVPPDGAEARLHVVVGDTIHPVVVQAIDEQLVRSISDATSPVITRLAVAG